MLNERWGTRRCDLLRKRAALRRFESGIYSTRGHRTRRARVSPALKRISKYERMPRGLKALAPPTRSRGLPPEKSFKLTLMSGAPTARVHQQKARRRPVLFRERVGHPAADTTELQTFNSLLPFEPYESGLLTIQHTNSQRGIVNKTKIMILPKRVRHSARRSANGLYRHGEAIHSGDVMLLGGNHV
jgi:hypothetical protein